MRLERSPEPVERKETGRQVSAYISLKEDHLPKHRFSSKAGIHCEEKE